MGGGLLPKKGCKTDKFPAIAGNIRIEIATLSPVEMASFYQRPRLQHKAPFDRMIIRQAIRQSRVLILKDASFPEYREFGLQVLW
jgi:PIN domain nuclease of toxin-antitoxin system